MTFLLIYKLKHWYIFFRKRIVFKGIYEKDGNEMIFIESDLYVSDFSINIRNDKIKISNSEMIDFEFYLKIKIKIRKQK